jgi:hypothetical protein
MAALTGLAAARSRGEYTSDWMFAAALAKGLNSTRSFVAPGVVNENLRPSTEMPLGAVRSDRRGTGVTFPSDRRTICAALPPEGVKRTS